jgi:predicted MFS family arabinose efflux permease
LAEHFRWQTAFTLFGAVGVAYSGLLIFTLREGRAVVHTTSSDGDRDGQPGMVATLSHLLREGSFWAMLAYFTLFSMAYWTIYAWLPTYLGEHFKLGQGAAGLSATAYLQFASFPGIILGGAIADQWSRSSLRGRIYVPLIGFCVAGPALFLVASTDVLGVAIGALLVFGLARGFADANNMPILCQIVDRRHRATGYGILNFSSCLAGGVMTYAAGALMDANIGLQRVFQCSAVGVVVAALLLLLIKPRKDLEET